MGAKLWRLSYQSFTLKELQQQLSEEWGVPPAQLYVVCAPKIEAKVKLRLAEGVGIVSPVKQ
jgi:hypothetical protein